MTTSIDESTQDATPRELYLFVRGVTEWAYTSSDGTVVYAGRTYDPRSIARTGVEHSNEDESGGITITLPTSDPIAQPFVGFEPNSPLFVTVFTVHRTGQWFVAFAGRVIGWKMDGPESSLTCVGLGGALTRAVPTLLYQKQCNRVLYGPGCDVNKLAFRDAAVVTGVVGRIVEATEFALRPDGWYIGGWVELRDGARAGDKRFVMDHVGTAITLIAPFAEAGVGANVYAFAGCDRLEATCLAKFNNHDRFLGFPTIPTKNPHDGRMG